MSKSKPQQVPIAIVGASALFPGSIDEGGFWRDILAGRDLITDVPPGHWLIEDYYDADPSAPDKTYARRGAFLNKVDFNPLEFGVPPSIVPATDSAQLLALIVAQRVLDEASGGQFASMDKSRISVILGVTSAQELLGSMVSRLQRPVWKKALRDAGVPESKAEEVCQRISDEYVPWQESTFPGLLGNVVAGRIANRLDLGGTNCVTDAACASAFSAVSMGINELYLRQSDLVVTGGVDTMNDIFMYMCFSKTPALSKTGDCRPFSDRADGTMLGEGLGMTALKRLDDAERDGDRIYAVLQGLGSSSDGRAKSVYAPRPEGQASALRRAYAAAGYGADTVELVEAHGTGTMAGDAAEFAGLRLAFDETGRSDRQWCALGSVKSQIGHTKAAAGAAGLFKTVMALHHKVLPPTIKVDKPNPELELEASPFYLNTEARPWVHGSDYPRRASVSSFGFGGSNFHVALEEYKGPSPRPHRLRHASNELVVFAADTPNELVERLRGVEIGGERFLQWFARDTQAKVRVDAKAKVAILARDDQDLAAKLAQAAEHIERTPDTTFSVPSGIHYANGAKPGKVAFLFPGQGSQYLGMGADLAMADEAALEIWDHAADLDFGEADRLPDVVFPKPVFTDEERRAQAARLVQTEWAQPAIGAVSLAQLQVLDRLGIRADCVGGHSYGEVTALCAAGVYDDKTTIQIARRRGELMRDAAKNPGSMTAVVGDIDDVRKVIESSGHAVVVANHNSPKQVVLSGPTDQIEKIEGSLSDAGLRAKRLPVATAFHSSIVSSASAPFSEMLADVDFKKPEIPVYANSEAAPYPSEGKEMRRILAEQITRPVRFVEQIKAMYESGVRTFVEVGPHSVLTGLVDQILDGRAHRAVPMDRAKKDGLTALQEAIGRLFVLGTQVSFSRLWERHAGTKDPRLVKKPPMALDIDGTNYGKPYPPAEGAAGLPAPNPEQEPEVIVKEIIKEVPVPVAGPATAAPHVGDAHPSTAHAPTQAIGAQSRSHGLPVPEPLANVYSSWVTAYQEAQRHTAEAHTAWQQSMSQTHVAFLQAAERSFAELSHIVSHTPIQAGAALSIAASVAAQSPMAPPPLPNQSTVPTFDSMMDNPPPQPDLAAFVSAVRAPAPTATEVARVATQPTAQPQAPAVAVAPVASPAVSLDMNTLLLDVVADKTGYPADMLTMDMGLESDLGIDSIKRVEILAAMRERAPELPEVDTSVMASLQTLGSIVDYMRSQLPAEAAPAVASGTPAPTAPAPGIDLKQLLLEVVADKTGYPADMLTMDMGLESDLGIDSIKRVEILAAMRERAPELPEVDTSVMASLQTLGSIVDHMQAGLSEPAAAGPAAVAPVALAASIDLKQLLLEVVADKTGYPADMLTMDMGLESDLGIDSIKRVEILAAMRERAPELPEVDTSIMASLQTLGSIVDHMQAGLPAPAAAEPAAAPGSAQVATRSTVAESAAPAPAVDLQQLLLDVVADKTGYPADMLRMDMELESDLGIDSIKRVEILAAVRERSPELPEVDTSIMATLRTLGSIVEHMRERNIAAPSTADRLADAAATANAAPSMTRAASTPSIGRFILETAPTVADDPGATSVLEAGMSAAVTDDGGGVAEAIVAALSELGVSASVVDAVPADVDVVISLSGLRDFQSIDQALALERDVFRAAKAVAERFSDQGGVFLTVQDTGGDFGLGGSERAWVGGIAGLTKTVALEWPEAKVKAIDLERGDRDPSAQAAAIVAELGAGGAEVEVALRADGTRATLVSVPRAVEGGQPAVSESSVIVATGGGRGVTAATLIELARRATPRLALLGRTPLEREPEAYKGIEGDAALKRAVLGEAKAAGRKVTPAQIGKEVAHLEAMREIRATLAALEDAGSPARYLAVDVQNDEALNSALARVRADWGPITGIVHGAGVLADKLVTDKTQEQFDRVFDTKVEGLRALLAATESDPLEVICLFSSVAARCGNPGQVDYAMANEVLNKVAALEASRRPDCLVKSLNWGPWAGGMVTPALKAQFEARGVPLIPLDAGARMFADELLGSDRSQIELVLGGEPRRAALLESDGPKSTDFDLTVDARSYPYLADHSIQNVPVVPVVMVLEWFARAAEAVQPSLELVACRNLKVLKGIRLEHFRNGGDHFTLGCIDRSNGHGTTLGLELRGDDGTRHYSAELDLAKQMPQPSGLPQPTLKLRDWTAKIYGDSLFHGPDFQVIRSLDGVSDNGIAAVLAGTRELGWAGEGQWKTDVAAMDGGLQLALLWTDHVLGGRSLPTSVGEYHGYVSELPAGPIRCVLEGEVVGGQKTVSNITFTSQEGQVLAELRGVETHLLPKGTTI